MANTDLKGNWVIRISRTRNGNPSPTFPTPSIVTINDNSITVNGNVVASLANFTLSQGNMHADFQYLEGGNTYTGYMHCIPASSPTATAAILGGATTGDPETVAVWGGDDE